MAPKTIPAAKPRPVVGQGGRAASGSHWRAQVLTVPLGDGLCTARLLPESLAAATPGRARSGKWTDKGEPAVVAPLTAAEARKAAIEARIRVVESIGGTDIIKVPLRELSGVRLEQRSAHGMLVSQIAAAAPVIVPGSIIGVRSINAAAGGSSGKGSGAGGKSGGARGKGSAGAVKSGGSGGKAAVQPERPSLPVAVGVEVLQLRVGDLCQLRPELGLWQGTVVSPPHIQPPNRGGVSRAGGGSHGSTSSQQGLTAPPNLPVMRVRLCRQSSESSVAAFDPLPYLGHVYDVWCSGMECPPEAVEAAAAAPAAPAAPARGMSTRVPGSAASWQAAWGLGVGDTVEVVLAALPGATQPIAVQRSVVSKFADTAPAAATVPPPPGASAIAPAGPTSADPTSAVVTPAAGAFKALVDESSAGDGIPRLSLRLLGGGRVHTVAAIPAALDPALLRPGAAVAVDLFALPHCAPEGAALVPVEQDAERFRIAQASPAAEIVSTARGAAFRPATTSGAAAPGKAAGSAPAAATAGSVPELIGVVRGKLDAGEAFVALQTVTLSLRAVVIREYGLSPAVRATRHTKPAPASSTGRGSRSSAKGGAARARTAAAALLRATRVPSAPLLPVSDSAHDAALVALPAKALLAAGVRGSLADAQTAARAARRSAKISDAEAVANLRVAAVFGAVLPPLPPGSDPERLPADVIVLPVPPCRPAPGFAVPLLRVGDEVQLSLCLDFEADAAGSVSVVACRLSRGVVLGRELGVVVSPPSGASDSCVVLSTHSGRAWLGGHRFIVGKSAMIARPPAESGGPAPPSDAAPLPAGCEAPIADPFMLDATADWESLSLGDVVAFDIDEMQSPLDGADRAAGASARGRRGSRSSVASGSKAGAGAGAAPAGASRHRDALTAGKDVNIVRLRRRFAPGTAPVAGIREAAQAISAAPSTLQLVPTPVPLSPRLLTPPFAAQVVEFHAPHRSGVPPTALLMAVIKLEQAFALCHSLGIVPRAAGSGGAAPGSALGAPAGSACVEVLPIASGEALSSLRALFRDARRDRVEVSRAGPSGRIMAGLASACGLMTVTTASQVVVLAPGAEQTPQRRARGGGRRGGGKGAPAPTVALAAGGAPKTWQVRAAAAASPVAVVQFRAALLSSAPAGCSPGDVVHASLAIDDLTGCLWATGLAVRKPASKVATPSVAASPPGPVRHVIPASASAAPSSKALPLPRHTGSSLSVQAVATASAPTVTPPSAAEAATAPPAAALAAGAEGAALSSSVAPGYSLGVVASLPSERQPHFFIDVPSNPGGFALRQDLFAPLAALKSRSVGVAAGLVALRPEALRLGLVVQFTTTRDGLGRLTALHVAAAPKDAANPMLASVPVSGVLVIEPAALPAAPGSGGRGPASRDGRADLPHPTHGTGLLMLLDGATVATEGASKHVSGRLPAPACAVRHAISTHLASSSAAAAAAVAAAVVGPGSSVASGGGSGSAGASTTGRSGGGGKAGAEAPIRFVAPPISSLLKTGHDALQGSLAHPTSLAARPGVRSALRQVEAVLAAAASTGAAVHLPGKQRGRGRGRGDEVPSRAVTAVPPLTPADLAAPVNALLAALPGGALIAFAGDSAMEALALPTHPGRRTVPVLVAGDELQFSATVHLRKLAEALWELVASKTWQDHTPSEPAAAAAKSAAPAGNATTSDAKTAGSRGNRCEEAEEVLCEPEPSMRLQLLWERIFSMVSLHDGRVVRASPARARGIVTTVAGDGSYFRATIDSLSPTLLHSLGPEWSSLRLIGACASQLPLSAARWGKNSSWQVFIAASEVRAGADLRMVVHPAHRHVEPAAEPDLRDSSAADLGSPAVAAAATASATAPDAAGKRRGRGGRGDLPSPVSLERGSIVEYSLVPPAGSSRSLHPLAVRVFCVARPRSREAGMLEQAPPDHRLWFGPRPLPAERPRVNARLRAHQSAAGTPRGGATNASAPTASGFAAGRGRGRGAPASGAVASGVVPGTTTAAVAQMVEVAPPVRAQPPLPPPAATHQ